MNDNNKTIEKTGFYFGTEQSALVLKLLDTIVKADNGDQIEIEYKGRIVTLTKTEGKNDRR
jgi:hypothetical protein